MSLSVFLMLLTSLLSGCGGILLLRGRTPRQLRIVERLKDISRSPELVNPFPATVVQANRFAVRLWWIQRPLVLARISMPGRWVILIATTALLITTLTVSTISPAYGVGLVGGLLCLTIFYINYRASKNRRQFLQHLPSFIERLQQLLGAGNSAPTAFEKALEYSDAVVQAYLRPVSRRLTHGATFSESLNLQALRLGLPELSLLSVMAHANARFGGSLSEVLQRVATLMVDRMRVQKEFDAMTAEMRASAKVLVFLQVVVLLFVLATNPDYLAFFLQVPLGHILLAIALGMIITGTVILRFMCRIEA